MPRPSPFFRKRTTNARRPSFERLETRDVPAFGPIGSEFLANQQIVNDQIFPRVAMDDLGGFGAVWQDSGQDGFNAGIFYRRFDSLGVAALPEIQVNVTTTDNQMFPDIAMAPSGVSTIVWQSFAQDGSENGIYFRQFSDAGLPQGPETRVNTTTANNQDHPVVAMDYAGNFVVAWNSAGQDGSGSGVYLRRFNAAGTPLSGEIAVNTITDGDQSLPAVAMDEVGNFVVAWSSNDAGSTESDILLRRFDDTGAPLGNEIRVNSTLLGDQVLPSVACDRYGNIFVVWQGPNSSNNIDIYGRKYDRFGIPLTAEVEINGASAGTQARPQIRMSGDGAALITWTTDVEGGNKRNVVGAAFTPEGGVLSPEATINTFLLEDQAFPAIAMNARRDAVAVWQSFGQDSSFNGVFSQRFDASGAPVDILLKPAAVNENAVTGTIVGAVSAVDPDVGDTVTLSLIDDAGGRFTLVGDQLNVADGDLLDFETAASHTIRVRAVDASSNAFERNLVVDLNDRNEQPTDIGLSAGAVDENSANETVVGVLSLVDVDVNDTSSFLLTDTAGGRFKVVGNQLRVANAAGLDFESATSHDVKVKGIDSGGLFVEKTFTISINNRNEPPATLTLNGHTVAENSPANTFVGALSATDPDVGDALSLSILDTAGGRFKLDGNAIRIDVPKLDFETATSHSIVVRVRDQAGLTLDKSFVIQVTNVDEAPSFISLSNTNVLENSLLHTVIGTLATPDDAGDTNVFSLVDDAGGRLKIVGNELQVAKIGAFNFELEKIHSIRVRVVDKAGQSLERSFDLDVINLNESPYHLLPGTQSLFRNGTLTFRMSANNGIRTWDVDAFYSFVETTLSVVTGSLKLGGTAGLFRATGDGTKSVVLRGNLNAICRAMDGLVYSAAPGYAGNAYLRISTTDLGASGLGGPKSATNTLKMTIVNRPPTVPLSGLFTTFYYRGTKNKTLVISPEWGVVRGKKDIDGDGVRPVILKKPPIGVLWLKTDGSFNFVPPTGFTGRVEFTFRYFDGMAFSATAAKAVITVS